DVMDREHTWLMVDMMKDVIRRGTAFTAVWKAGFTYPAAGKTGTTDDYTDAWFIGYTPEPVAGIWVGYDIQQRILEHNAGGGRIVAPAWTAFMRDVYDRRPAPPNQDGAVLVDVGGRIAAIGPNSQVPTPPEVEALEFPAAVLVPGLVNCHTHLELTHLAGRNAERDFVQWIRAIRTLKDATPPAEFSRAAEQGVRDCWAAGVTCVADTGSSGSPLEALARLGARGIYYQEVFGPDPAQCAASAAELTAALERLRPLVSARVR